MRLLVTGADGLLGSAMVRAARERGHEVLESVRSGPEEESKRRTSSIPLDVTDRDRVARVVSGAAPDAVVHCAGYTDVDAAESHRKEALEVNVSGARWVARAAADSGSLVLLPSTDYVFDGTSSRPYRPGDSPNPLNLYGKSKWMGEEEVRMSGARWIVVRTSWLYGRDGNDFVDAILDAARERGRSGGRRAEGPDGLLRVVDDQRGRPTWTGSIGPALIRLLEGETEDRRITGASDPRSDPGTREPNPEGAVDAAAPGRTLHLADRGDATWYELAVEALRLAGMDVEVVPVSSEEWGAPAPRPRYSVLDISAAEECLGFTMPPWTKSLRRYLEG